MSEVGALNFVRPRCARPLRGACVHARETYTQGMPQNRGPRMPPGAQFDSAPSHMIGMHGRMVVMALLSPQVSTVVNLPCNGMPVSPLCTQARVHSVWTLWATALTVGGSMHVAV